MVCNNLLTMYLFSWKYLEKDKADPVWEYIL